MSKVFLPNTGNGSLPQVDAGFLQNGRLNDITSDWYVQPYSRDGDLMARVEEGLGFRVVRGSSGKGGARALVEMIKAQRADRALNSCLAVDGSRGPRGVAQLGILTLAQKTVGLVLPVAASTDRAFVYGRSWDRIVVPRPRATIRVRFAEPFAVPAGLDEDGTEALRARLERTLLDLHEGLDRATGFHDSEPLRADP